MWLQSIQQAIDYIERNLMEDLQVEQLAKITNLSSYHFQRAFSFLTGMTLGEYIRGRRLTLAAQEIASSDCKIIDIAYKYGYETPEAFAKAFRKQHGMKPTDARDKSRTIHSYNKLVIQVQLKGAEPMNYKIIEKDSFQVVGLKRTFSCVNGEQSPKIARFWQDVNQDGTSGQLAVLIDGTVQGLIGICEVTSKDIMDYWIAASHDGEYTGNFETYTVPASKWAIFEVHGAMPDAMPIMWQKIFQEWLPSHPYELAETPELEVYGEGNPSNDNYYSEIWVPIK
ncbi:MAG TPA: AraC family transcriptional regulator [Rummeliibacillus sp.]|nr:AraC family transcriptional regulator [Rummeliibacillus sp.]